MNNKILLNLHKVITDLENAGMQREASSMQRIFVKVAAGPNADYESSIRPTLIREMRPEDPSLNKAFQKARTVEENGKSRSMELGTIAEINTFIENVRAMNRAGELSEETKKFLGKAAAVLYAELTHSSE